MTVIAVALVILAIQPGLRPATAQIGDGCGATKTHANKLAATKANEEQAAKLSAELAQAKVGVTQSDLDKAKKTSPYYPEPASAEGKALAAVWNAKWSGKDVSGSLGDLAQKVAEYKVTAAQISALASKEQTAAKAAAETAAAKAKEEYAKNHAAEIAKAAEADTLAEADENGKVIFGTEDEMRALVLRWRAEHDAVMTAVHKLQALGEPVTDEAVAALMVPPHKSLAFDVSAATNDLDDDIDDDLSDLNEYPDDLLA
ncbi:MAG TPA: hypothetical protein VIJ35_05670 [Bradyrhizobium sp.]